MVLRRCSRQRKILFRRIGHNELAAINVCKGVVAAQHDYAAKDMTISLWVVMPPVSSANPVSKTVSIGK